MLLLDVTPLSLGVETGGGVFTRSSRATRRSRPRRARSSRRASTTRPSCPIHVLQGERKMAADNRSLARFELTGHPAGAARRAEDPGHVPHRRERHRERRGEGPRHRARRRQSRSRRRAASRRRRSSGSSPRARRSSWPTSSGASSPSCATRPRRCSTRPSRRSRATPNLVDADDARATTRARPRSSAGCSRSRRTSARSATPYQKLEAMTFAIAEKMYGGEARRGRA